MTAWMKSYFITESECHVHKNDIPDKGMVKAITVVDKAIEKMLKSSKVK